VLSGNRANWIDKRISRSNWQLANQTLKVI